jgi:hypothetical protein
MTHEALRGDYTPLITPAQAPAQRGWNLVAQGYIWRQTRQEARHSLGD